MRTTGPSGTRTRRRATAWRPRGPGTLRQQSIFNLGNSLVRAAEDAPERGQLLLDAVAAYEEALRLDPADQDAKWNLELALQRLEEDRMAGGSSGRGRAADYGRGNMNVPGYEGNPEAATGAMAGGGYGAGQGESADALDPEEARQLLDAMQREQLASHEGRPSAEGADGGSGLVGRLRVQPQVRRLESQPKPVVICGLLQPR